MYGGVEIIPSRPCKSITEYNNHYTHLFSFTYGYRVWVGWGAELVKPGGDTNYYEFYKPPEKIDHSREVEVLWYWNKPDDILAIVANDVLVKSGPNPYKHKQLPFVRVIDVKRPYHFYAKGEAELLESLQDENNTLRRMIIDRNHLDIDKPILVSDTLTIEDEDVASRPHGIIPVGDVNAAKPLEYSDIPKSVFMSLELLNDDKIRVSGMDERQQSVSAAGTATEAAILKEATLKRLNLKIWQIKNDTLVDLGRLRVSNILQFYSQPKLTEITGEAMLSRSDSGNTVQIEGKKYMSGYRNIRLKDQSVNLQNGIPQVSPSKGFTFFEVRPEYFTPTYGSFDIRYKASSSMPISRPLEQQKTDELYDRLIKNPTVDPWKLAEMMLNSREKDASQFKMQQQGQQGQNGVDVQKMIDLASVENEEMLKGNPIKPTPYASPVHTEIHISFMQSNEFKKLAPADDNKILQLFANHITGEITAQKLRGGMPGAISGQIGGQSPAPGMPPSTPIQDVIPDKITGGGEVPTGMAGANSGVQVGRKV